MKIPYIFLYIYYHTDHLGSATLVTDDAADVVQQIAYLPYGEDWIDVRSNGYFGSAYKFNGKEKDDETGYSYYGARYYTDRLSIWLSVDPLADKYPHLSPYAYCADNPVMLVDPDGMQITDYFNLYGKHVKHVNDGSNAKKQVITTSVKIAEVDKAIAKGYVINAPTPEVGEQMKKVRKLTADTKGNEHMFVSNGGDKSDIFTSNKPKELTYETVMQARKNFKEKFPDKQSDLEFHDHGYLIDENGEGIHGAPTPSSTDIDGATDKIEAVTGDDGTGASIGFYNKDGAITPNSGISFSRYLKGLKKIENYNNQQE